MRSNRKWSIMLHDAPKMIVALYFDEKIFFSWAWNFFFSVNSKDNGLILKIIFPDASAVQREREERVRKIRKQHEEEQQKKIEELKLHVSFYQITMVIYYPKGDKKKALKKYKSLSFFLGSANDVFRYQNLFSVWLIDIWVLLTFWETRLFFISWC